MLTGPSRTLCAVLLIGIQLGTLSQSLDDSEGVSVTLQSPKPGDFWTSTVQVSLAISVDVSASGVRENPQGFVVCYWGGEGNPLCHSLVGEQELPTIPVASPELSSGLSTVQAWVQRTERPDSSPEFALVGSLATCYLWLAREVAAAELQRRLNHDDDSSQASSLGGGGDHDDETTHQRATHRQLLKLHLEKTMEPLDTYVQSSYGTYRITEGFGTYGMHNAMVHYWGSPNSSITLGRFCSIASGVEFFIDGNHQLKHVTTYPFKERGGLMGFAASGERGVWQNNGKGPIVLGNDVWVGRGAVFLSGVRVGHGAVVGTRAVVTKDVPPFSVVAGNPGRVVKRRFDNATIARLLEVAWWDWPHERIGGALEQGALLGGDVASFLEWAELKYPKPSS